MLHLKKFTYWVDKKSIDSLKKDFLARRKRITPIKSIPCKGLHELVDIGYVAPEEWSETCKRQGTWYTESEKNGLYLVVSNEPLQDLKINTIIESSWFEPKLLPNRDSIERLAHSLKNDKAAPGGWFNVTQEDKDNRKELVKKMGVS